MIDEIEIELKRNKIKTVIFFVIGVISISFLLMVIIQITHNRLIIYGCLVILSIILFILLELSFFKKEIKYKIIEEKETWYGTLVIKERIK